MDENVIQYYLIFMYFGKSTRPAAKSTEFDSIGQRMRWNWFSVGQKNHKY